jgi:hypothetical protein
MSTTSYRQIQEKPKSAFTALWVGIIFSFAFTGLIWVLGPYLPPIDFLPDSGASWYYWKLPEPTFWSRATAWGGYMLHQVALWWLIYRAQSQKLKYTNGLHRVNVLTLAINAFLSSCTSFKATSGTMVWRRMSQYLAHKVLSSSCW